MQHLVDKTALLVPVCLTAFVVTVAITDMARQRIPNVLTVGGAAIGLLTNILSMGGPGALSSVAGLFSGLALFLPLYLTRGFSAGDVKAMAAIGAFLGPKGALLAAAWILAAGAFAGMILLISMGGLGAVRAMAQRWCVYLGMLISTGAPDRIPPPADDAASRRFPYGLAIACGTLASLAWS